jgi:hypothetical protein
MEEKKYTWAEVVKMTQDTVLRLAGDTDDEMEKALYAEITERHIKYSNAISLARIATALYKMAEIPDEFTDENIFEELKE